MAVSVKSINQQSDAKTTYPSIKPSDLNILVERVAAGTQDANQEHLKTNLGGMIDEQVATQKAQANGLATLDPNGKIPTGQIPSMANDVMVTASLPTTGVADKLYIRTSDNTQWYWSNGWVQILDIEQAITQGQTAKSPSSAVLYAALALKQGALTFDASPTQGSTNPVTSGGVYTAVQDVQGQINDLGLSVVNGQLYMTYDE